MKAFTIKAQNDKESICLTTIEEKSYEPIQHLDDTIDASFEILKDLSYDILEFFKLLEFTTAFISTEPVVNNKGRLILTTDKNKLISVAILKGANNRHKKIVAVNNLIKVVNLLTVVIKEVEFKATGLITEFEITLK